MGGNSQNMSLFDYSDIYSSPFNDHWKETHKWISKIVKNIHNSDYYPFERSMIYLKDGETINTLARKKTLKVGFFQKT